MADHSGHRDRLRKKFSEGTLEDHELLELLLFGALPRVNTNEIAHDLIDRFSSLKEVFYASEIQLTEVKGVGKNTAIAIAAMGECVRRCSKGKIDKRKVFKSLSSIKNLAVNLLAAASEEQVYLMAFNHSRKMISCLRVARGYEASVILNLREIVNEAVKHQAAFVAIAHNHPDGSIAPSDEDIKATRMMKNSFEAVGISFIDNFVVCGGVCRGVLLGK